MIEPTLRSLHDEAIEKGMGWFVHDGMIELVPQADEDSLYNRELEQKLLKMGVRWIWV